MKESIRSRGVLSPIIVSRDKNPSTQVRIASGKKRFELVRSLYNETTDPKFLQVEGVKRTFSKESKFQLSGLIQNDQCRKPRFIERASAVMHCIRLILEELGVASITDRSATKLLADSGYPISQSLYRQMKYAVEELLPILPRALHSGIGRPQIERIRDLERLTRKIWDHYSDPDYTFDEVFPELCKKSDSEYWNFEDLRYFVENEVSLSCEIELNTVRLMIDLGLELVPECIEPRIIRDPRSVRAKNSTTGKRRTSEGTVSPLARQATNHQTQILETSSFNKNQVFLLRRRRFARKLATKILGSSNLSNYVRASKNTVIGFEIPKKTPRNTDVRAKSIWKYIYTCQLGPDSSYVRPQKLEPSWNALKDEQWLDLMSLMDVTRELNRNIEIYQTKKVQPPTSISVA